MHTPKVSDDTILLTEVNKKMADVPQEKFDELVMQRDGLKSDLREVKEKNMAFGEEIDSLKSKQLSTDDLKFFDEWKVARDKKTAGETVTKAEMQLLREEDTQKHKTEMETAQAEYEKKFTELDSEIDRLTVDSQIELAVIASGVERGDDKDVVSQVMQIIKPSVKREKTDDGYRVVCMESDGTIRQTSDGVMPVQDHVVDFLKNNTHFLPFNGSGPRLPSRISGDGGRITDYWERPPSENLEAIYKK